MYPDVAKDIRAGSLHSLECLNRILARQATCRQTKEILTRFTAVYNREKTKIEKKTPRSGSPEIPTCIAQKLRTCFPAIAQYFPDCEYVVSR
jgi:hypothetical protein